ncbi:MAG: right-handed parallel beta-helix repeat-containing protein, partial [Candidatus Melainabacteria bacterium]|nr:right-handed parallel beta-helix repeat-containing protein [Candidatus Melainabacteria bacterium]
MIRLSLVLVILLSPLAIYAESFDLSDGMSIQDTIDLASDGDTINLAAGTYTGDIDFRGKAISVVGQGRDSVINGSGEGPVVNFDNGEGFLSLLDQVRVTGGKDEGAVHIKDSSPRVNRSWILANKSLDHASGIFIENGSPTFFNNVISNNRRAKGGDDPHQVYIDGASPNFINNTIIRGDSNGIFITGDSAPRLSNNIIAYNGKGSKGRGICIISFSNGLELDHNLFFRNLLADIFAPGSGGDFN